MKSFNIKGMNCASCAVIIEKKLKKLDGIAKVNVNFATEKAQIDFNEEKVSVDKMNDEIGKFGYTLHSGEEMTGMVKEGAREMMGMSHAEHLNMNASKEDKAKELSEKLTKVKFIFPLSIS